VNPLLLALVQAGILAQADAERIQRTLDPEAARLYAESTLQAAVQGGLTSQQARLVEMVRQTNGSLSPARLDAFWAGEDERLYAALRPTLSGIATERAIVAAVGLVGDETWTLVNEATLDWLDDYYLNADAGAFGSLPNLNLTSRSQFANAFRDWSRGEMEAFGARDGLPQLIRSLEPAFGPTRAARVAMTETTRIFVETERAAGAANPFIEGYTFQTSNDSITCPICAPANGTFAEKGASRFPDGGGFPPRHPGCRCGISPETRATRGVPNTREMARAA
jgi:SPP1 gp7 family putative phage head morphogenesis protein